MMNAEVVIQVTEIPDEVQRWTVKRKVALVAAMHLTLPGLGRAEARPSPASLFLPAVRAAYRCRLSRAGSF